MITVLLAVLVCTVTSWLVVTSDWCGRYLDWVEKKIF